MNLPVLRGVMVLVLVLAVSGIIAVVDAHPVTARCSPPVPRDISLGLQVHADGGRPPVAGSAGELVFRVRNLESAGAPVASIISHFPDHGLPVGEALTLRLREVADGGCAVVTSVDTVGGEPRTFHTLHVAAAAPGDTATCRVRFEIAQGAAAGFVQWRAMPSGLCVNDPAPADNTAGFAFGDSVAPATAVPAQGRVAIGVLVLAALLSGIAAAGRRAVVRPPRPG